MTCRRPTISVRASVLKRLAQAATLNNGDTAPDSLEFEAVDWQDIERTSLTEGLDEIVALQEALQLKQAEEENVRRAALEEKRLHQIAEAQAWERTVMEQRRAEQLAARIEIEKARVRVVVAEELRHADEAAERRLALQKTEQNLEIQVASFRQAQKRRALKRTVYGTFAAAAVFGLALTAAFSGSERTRQREIAELRDEARDVESAALLRVQELEAEIARTEHMLGSERGLLSSQLDAARTRLAQAELEREALEVGPSRSPAPRKLASQAKPARAHAAANQDLGPQSTERVKVAGDLETEPTCAMYDPMCFEL